VARAAHDALHRFVVAARGQNGLAVLTERVDENLGVPLAEALVAHGVGHVAGPMGEWTNALAAQLVFRDESPLSPVDLAPVSSFSRFGDAPISYHWNRRRNGVRFTDNGDQLVDILLVPAGSRIGGKEVGRDIPALAGTTALEMLGKA
jgi:hypothetical protein